MCVTKGSIKSKNLKNMRIKWRLCLWHRLKWLNDCWTLTIARFSIHKAAANFRIHKEGTPILPIFRAITKSIIRFQFKIHELKGKQFPGVWCIGYAFAKLENYDLVFIM